MNSEITNFYKTLENPFEEYLESLEEKGNLLEWIFRIYTKLSAMIGLFVFIPIIPLILSSKRIPITPLNIFPKLGITNEFGLWYLSLFLIVMGNGIFLTIIDSVQEYFLNKSKTKDSEKFPKRFLSFCHLYNTIKYSWRI